MRFWVGVSAAFGAGTLIGIAAGVLLVEDKLKKEYAESSATLRRVYEARAIDAETPMQSEDELGDPLFLIKHDDNGVNITGGRLESISVDKEPNAFGETLSVKPIEQSTNPYHEAVMPSTGIYASFAELEEEEYYEEDGREKDQLTMIFDDGLARFFNKGEEIDDAFERVGGTIVDDMRKAVGEGNPTLWVRNNQTDVDYEVIFEQP